MKRAALALLASLVLLCGTARGVTTILQNISVDEYPVTGYKWFYLVSDETVLSVDDQGYAESDGDGPMSGEKGTHSWMVSGKREGQASVTFASLYPWVERNTDPIITYTFSVDADENLTILNIEKIPEEYAPGRTTIRLIENPTTGYHWELEENPEGVLRLIVDAYEQDLSSENMIGAGGVHNWVFRGEAQGETTLVFRYFGPSEEDREPAATVKFLYTVNANLQVDKPGIQGDYTEYNPYMQK